MKHWLIEIKCFFFINYVQSMWKEIVLYINSLDFKILIMPDENHQ